MSTGKIELSVGAVKIADKYEIFTKEEINNIDKIPDIEDEIEEINSSLDNKANKEHTHEPQINCDTVDNLHFVCLTKSEYDTLETKDSNTLYFIKKEAE